MSNFFTKAVLFLIVTLSLQAKDGLSQEHLFSVSPEVSAKEVSAESTIEITFDLPIVTNSVHKHTITLISEDKHEKNKKVRGKTTIKDEKILLFTPDEALESGTYRLKVSKVKLQNFSDKHENGFRKYSHKMCSYFYDDVKECSLYRYACSVKTKKIKYTFSVDDNKPKITSITLNKSNIQLNENNQTTISVNAIYDDNSTLNITDDVEWILSNSSIVSIDKGTITPLSEGSTTLQAKFNDQTTAIISITVYEEINGHRLPPQPDETLNNSTLLGIDVNNNGVRDDVERWIFSEYKEPIVQAVAMQNARAFQIILVDPSSTAKITTKYMEKVNDCTSYYQLLAEDYNDTIVIPRRKSLYKEQRPLMLNTRERNRAYYEYNQALSGGVYPGRPWDTYKASCDFNETKILNGEWE